MSSHSESERSWLATLGTAVPLVVIFFAVLSIPLSVAQTLDLSSEQTVSWILVAYALPSLLSLGLAAFYRQPLILTGNLFALIFVNSLGSQLAFDEIIGAYMVAGVGVLLISVLGLTGRLARWVPEAVVFGLLAGAIFSFLTGIFVSLGQSPLIIGGTLLVYLMGRRLGGQRLPAILPAILTGLLLTAATGQFGPLPASFDLPVPTVTQPLFSLDSIVTAVPVLIVVIVLQANLPSLIFLQAQAYEPPTGIIDTVSGVGTIIGSLLGPLAVSLSLPATALLGGSDAGARDWRHRGVYIAAAAGILIGLLAGLAADLPDIIPVTLLQAVAGLAMINVFADALEAVTRGPLLLGPLFAFVVAASNITLLGLGSLFWALLIGLGVSALLEQDTWRQLRQQD
ncbi:MAG: benzoate/H(+) symporter BenE family transporter [Candidatus Promineifilaceae bacterium]|nr:benzoate/H(+) symporter BenE family transporter [Candidatus Promineifilaceae bacterium]